MFWLIVLEIIWIPILIGLIRKYGFLKTWGCCIIGFAAFSGIMTLLLALRGCVH